MSIMLNNVLVAVVAFVAGCGVAAFGLVRRRRPPAATARAVLPAPLQESVTAFGEELQTLTVTPEEIEADPGATEDYSTALLAYDRAAAAEHEQVALVALRDGRAALIRLAARRAERPVPIDALPPLEADRSRSEPPGVPENATGERFLTLGAGGGTVEVLIDRPEPGRPAIVEVTCGGDLCVSPVVRTEDETDTGSELVINYEGAYHGRVILGPKPTHLRIECVEEAQRWSVRIRPMSAAPLLGSEWRGGGGDEVLFYDGGPALLTVQARSEGAWSVEFECGCLRGGDCRCRTPRWPAGMPEGSGDGWGTHDGRRAMRLPRPGYLILEASEKDHEWFLSVEPFSEDPPPQSNAAQRFGRRSSM
ncbi:MULTISPECIES: hypothetical protein [unclassified Spirillospora]|uniref:hypothetical protein n=1 Tax=unclassified Spirillospora TaxID=2642701 RepID=UPI003723792F